MCLVKARWLWCLHCERAFLGDSINKCLYEGCDGHIGDIWEWSDIRESNPHYPEIPEIDKEYPMYGD